jgi:hypothetical protein
LIYQWRPPGVYMACAARANRTTNMATTMPMNVCHAVDSDEQCIRIVTVKRLTCTREIVWHRHHTDSVVNAGGYE